MNNNLIIFCIISLIYIFRFIYESKRKPYYILISYIIITIPLDLHIRDSTSLNQVCGTLPSVFILPVPIIVSLFIILFSHGFIKISTKINLMSFVFLLILIVSLINPFNDFKKGTLIFILFYFTYTYIYKLIEKICNIREVFKGIYDGFVILSIINIILSICFPLLNMVFVTEFIHQGSMELATRFGTRNGAIGLFAHPGNLAMFTLICISFFWASYLLKYYRYQSLILVIINIFILVLTYSRTSYIVAVIVIVFLNLLYKFPAKIFNIFSLLKFIIPVLIFLIWLVFFSFLSDIFLKSDLENQFTNRYTHSLMAYKIFSNSPLFGVGINSHLYYFTKGSLLSSDVNFEGFFLKNPIHNIHLIVLCETGLIGLLFWMIFIYMNINQARLSLLKNKLLPVSLAQVGVVTAYFLYGIFGWSPFSSSIFPFFILFTHFSNHPIKHVKHKIIDIL